MHLFAVLLLLCTAASSADGKNSTNSNPSGAEFLRSVIGNLHRPNRKVFNARIDVNEYIPMDVSQTGPGDELKILAKLPNSFMTQKVGYDTGSVALNRIGHLLYRIFSDYI